MNHGWEKKRWKQVLTIINGKNQNSVEASDGPYPIYGSGGIMGAATQYLCPEYCTIIGRKGSINKPIFVKSKFWNVDTAFGISPDTNLIVPKFLYYFCVNYNFLRHNKATTLPSLVKSDLLEILMPVPSQAVQRQIVMELDKINELIELKRKQLKDLETLAQSLFYEMFGDPIENPQGWDMKQIQEFAKTTAGGTPSKSHPEYYNGGKIPWLRSGEVCKMNISNTELCITDLGMQNSSAKLVPVNSVVVAMYGATAAQVGVIRSEMTLNQAICAIFPNSHTKPIFLYFCLSGLKESLLKVAHGAAQPNISQAIIKSTKIILPPISMQEEFSVRVEAIEGQKRVIESTISDLEVLLASRMDYWFND